jgi:alcohol dehydrogenase
MSALWRYANPVKITFGDGALASLGSFLQGRRWCLVSYDEPFFNALTQQLRDLVGAPDLVIDEVSTHPDLAALEHMCGNFGVAGRTVEAVVAVGGGSVMDAAKVLAVARGDFQRIRRLLTNGDALEEPAPLPIIAVPTTAGTGSEVTPWATIWDTDASKKYSLSLPGLFPEHAVVDPTLTLALPHSVTVSTGLDALSHALESIWNRNANSVSTAIAVAAANEILDCLPALASDLSNLSLRRRMAKASLLSGLAFSNTRTALAHSLSYGITLAHNVPHGIACSFTLPFVMRMASGHDLRCDAALRAIFGPDLEEGALRLQGFIESLGVSTRHGDYGVSDSEWTGLLTDALSGERGRNFIDQRAVTAQ